MGNGKKERNIDVVVVGAVGVGKSCFAGRLLQDKHFPRYDGWDDSELQPLKKAIQIEDETWSVEVHDLLLKPLHDEEPGVSPAYWNMILGGMLGVVLLYDIADKKSYDYVTKADYEMILSFRDRAYMDVGRSKNALDFRRFGGILVGNKVDTVIGENSGKREVQKALAEEWASMHGMKHFETHTFSQGGLETIMKELIKKIRRAELMDKEDLERETALNSDETSATQKPHGRNRFSSLSKPFSVIRHALPRVTSKSKETAHAAKEQNLPWSMFLASSTGPSTPQA